MSHEHPVTAEQLIEALEYSRGLISPAQKYLKEKYQYKTLDRSVIMNRIQDWGLSDFITDLHVNLVEECMSRRFLSALENGDCMANGWVVAKYGHHARFLKMKEDESTSVDKNHLEKFDHFMDQISSLKSERKIAEISNSEESKS